jgi:hypothetical protein
VSGIFTEAARLWNVVCKLRFVEGIMLRVQLGKIVNKNYTALDSSGAAVEI